MVVLHFESCFEDSAVFRELLDIACHVDFARRSAWPVLGVQWMLPGFGLGPGSVSQLCDSVTGAVSPC